MAAALALSAEQHIDATPEAVFALFGAGSGAGWLFDAACDRVSVGSVVTLRAPLFGIAAEPVEILGRISAVRFGSRIEIRHDQPWRGRLRVQFDAAGTGTRVRLIADLDDAGLQWLMRRRGFSVPDGAGPDHHAVGLVTSKSGPGSVFASATENLATMAVEEINADGGIRGKSVRLVVGDDATDATLGAGRPGGWCTPAAGRSWPPPPRPPSRWWPASCARRTCCSCTP
jgi:ABC-type branched-chain amino acid transport systems, periplasmic component